VSIVLALADRWVFDLVATVWMAALARTGSNLRKREKELREANAVLAGWARELREREGGPR
jgi:hypothetical protein